MTGEAVGPTGYEAGAGDLFGRHAFVFAAFLVISGAAAAAALAPVGGASPDMVNALIPWMNAVRAGGIGSISAEFSVYTPPYTYLMYLAQGLVPLVGTVTAIKLINAPFVGVLAAATFDLVRQGTGELRKAAVAGAAVCVAPTLLVNAFAWGQADVIYTSFVLLCVVFACRKAPVLAALAFGVAVSFKLQAIFISPLLLYLVLSRQMRIWHLLLVPATYLAMMTPAALAGRHWGGLLKIYLYQAETFNKLAVFAPNPWFFVHYLFDQTGTVYVAGVAIGLALAFLAGLAISVRALALTPGAQTTLLVATLCAGLMPYLLPKMHDRYFFMADILAIAFAFTFRRLWIVALLFQLGSLVAYLNYFGLSRDAPAFGFVPITLAVFTLLAAFVGASSRPAAPSLAGQTR